MGLTVAITTSTYAFSDIRKDLTVLRNPHGRRMTEDEVSYLLGQNTPAGMIAGVEPLTRKVLENCPSLRVISRCGVGLDSVDMKAAKDLGIRVYNTPDSPVDSAAELAFTLILAVYKNIIEAVSSVKSDAWHKPLSRLLRGKTAGMVGCGRIGTRLAELLAAFGCDLIGFDPFIESHRVCSLTTLEDLCRSADIISVHVPLVENTRAIIGENEFALMKKEAIIINTSRGGTVDEEALHRALKEMKISGAGLDVYGEEPYRGPLREFGPNVALTPHMASSAVEARIAMEKEAYENLMAGLDEGGAS